MKYQNVDLLKKCVGAAIFRLRKNRKLTGKQLGRAIGISQQQISRYECGMSGLDVSTCYHILIILHVSVEEFFSLTDEIYVSLSSAAGKIDHV